MGRRTALAAGIQMMCTIFRQKICLHFVHVQKLPETKIKGDRVIHIAGEISRQSNVDMVAWLTLGAFSQVYLENQEQRAQKSDLKCFEFSQ